MPPPTLAIRPPRAPLLPERPPGLWEGPLLPLVAAWPPLAAPGLRPPTLCPPRLPGLASFLGWRWGAACGGLSGDSL